MRRASQPVATRQFGRPGPVAAVATVPDTSTGSSMAAGVTVESSLYETAYDDCLMSYSLGDLLKVAMTEAGLSDIKVTVSRFEIFVALTQTKPRSFNFIKVSF